MLSAIVKFETALEKLNIRLDPSVSDKLYDYYKLLIEANSYMNLTAITDMEEVFIKHFADSLSLIRVLNDLNLKKDLSIIDIGCGAGFPGIPLKIAIPEIKLTSVDSTGKKIDFIHFCIEKLDLRSAVAIKARAEDLAHGEHRGCYDLALSRAVAKLSFLAEYSLPMLKVGGLMAAYKSITADEEIKEARSALEKLNAEIFMVDRFVLPVEESTRNLVIIKKTGTTDKRYPRTYGQIKSRPL